MFRVLHIILCLSVMVFPDRFPAQNFSSSEENIQKLMKQAADLKYSDWNRAKNLINSAEKSASESDNEEVLAKFRLNAAEIYYDRDLFDISLKYALASYEFYKTKDPEKAIAAENLMAIISGRMNNKKDALHHFRNIYKYGTENKDIEYSSRALNNIGTIYLTSQKPDSALYYYKKVIDIFPEQRNPPLIITTYINIARAFHILNKNKEAEEKFLQAEYLIEKYAANNQKSFLYNEMAKFYIDEKNADKAVTYANLAYENAKVKFSFHNKDALQNLYEAYYLYGDYKKSAEYFQLYDEVRENLNIEEKAVNLEKEKISNEYKNKEQRLELENNKKRLKLVSAILILVLGMSILSFFLVRYRNNLVKEKLENELTHSRENELKLTLELRNKELVSKSIFENERSSMNEVIISKLKEIRTIENSEELKKELGLVIFRLGKNPGRSSWEEFNLRFSNVYDSFYEKLKQLHPNLNHNDKRICAFIKLNLSSKEIADITKTTVKSVENSRTRLRKKLNLTNTKTELYQYLSEL